MLPAYLLRGGGRYCAVVGCHNSEKKIHLWRESECSIHAGEKGKDCPCLEPFRLHYFPKDDNKRRAWLKALNRKDFSPGKNAVVCSLHFIDGHPSRTNPNPELQLGYMKKVIHGRKHQQRILTSVPVLQRNTSVAENQSEIQTPHEFQEMCSSADDSKQECNCECHKICKCTCNAKQKIMLTKAVQVSVTTATEHDHQYVSKEHSNTKSNSVEIQVDRTCEISGTLGTKTCVYYTGLNLAVFQCLVLTLAPLANIKFRMNVADQLLLTLMRLRLGIDLKDLGMRFGVSKTTASDIFKAWITLMANHLRHLVMWLPRETIRATMPSTFRNSFPKTTCIVDCSEIFTERPINLTARSSTWSNYKSHNTLKFLICVAPNGFIMFISHLYGGRASDKFICSDSGFYNYLRPGDEVMGDRGIEISDELAMRRVSLNIPPFLRGRKQMTEEETTNTRRCATLRIHVERVIARLKSYRLLRGVVPANTRGYLSKVVLVCSALCNLKHEIIKSTDED